MHAAVLKWIVLSMTVALVPAAHGVEWTQLPGIPDREGFAGMFAGVSHDALIVAGGANFPDRKPWEGGTKVWYDTIFVLESPNSEWKIGGKLPRPLGYGVSVTYRDTVVCIGGGDACQNSRDCFRLEWQDGRIVTTTLPPLPTTVANACGALVGNVVYVAGGQETPDSTTALRTVFTLDLSSTAHEWKQLPVLPENGRILAVAASFDDAFWIMGGAELLPAPGGKSIRKYLTNAARYAPELGWEAVPDLPTPVVAAPTPAPIANSGIHVLGGDDASQLTVAPADHRGFSTAILKYDPAEKTWQRTGEHPAPRVTVPCVRWRDMYVFPSGEQRPGKRSPEVWSWKPK